MNPCFGSDVRRVENEGGAELGKVRGLIACIRALAPEEVEKSDIRDYELYFHIRTGHDGLFQRYAASSSYGLAEEVAKLIIEG